MNSEANNSGDSQEIRKNSGCSTFVVIYGLCLIAMYLSSTPPEKTTDFTGRTARDFTVAGVITGHSNKEPKYRVFNLEYVNSGELDLTGVTFKLPSNSITINVGDIHRAEILEEHDGWQLVAFHYSNTRTSTSIYRAYDNRIEPVSYKLTSHLGQAFSAIILLIPALVLSAIITAFLNWRARRRAAPRNP